jgi:hypothetical protein
VNADVTALYAAWIGPFCDLQARLNADLPVVAAISVAGPTARVVGRSSAVTSCVIEAAKRLSRALELAQSARA